MNYFNFGALTTKLRRFQNNFEAERSNVPKSDSSYMLTSQAEMERINNYRNQVFNKYKSGALALKNELRQLENNITYKTKNIFFPDSSGYDESKKTIAMQSRQLAVQKLQNGLNKEAILRDIDFQESIGNIDALGEMYFYLSTGSFGRGTTGTQLDLVNRLKKVFIKRGLDELKEMETDLKTAKGEMATIENRFKLN